MGLDPVSFLLGFGSASGIGYGLYRNRERLSRMQASTPSVGSITRFRQILRQSADKRYYTELTEFLEHNHLGGQYAKLSDVLVEPRLLALRPTPRSIPDDNAAPSDYEYIVPRIPEFPEMVSSYYMDSLPLSDIVAGDNHIALLGKTGIGKSTTLAIIALMAMDVVQFETLQSLTEQALEASLADLEERERETRLRELNEIQRNIVERLRETEQDITEEVVFEPPPPMTSFFPIYVDIAAISLDLNLYGLTVDPAEPVVKAFQQNVSLITAQTSPPLMYDSLTRGDALVLIDGFESLPNAEQKRVYQWLSNFLEHYGHNRVIVTGPMYGFDSLIHLGFTPVFVKPKAADENELLVEHWIDAWNARAGDTKRRRDKSTSTVPKEKRAELFDDILHRQPFELSLKTIATLLGNVKHDGFRGWYERYTREFLPDGDYSMPILREIAQLMLQRDIVLKQEQIVEIVTNHLLPVGAEEPLANIEAFTKQLIDSGLMLRGAGDTVYFRHEHLRDYFAAEVMINDMTPQQIAELGDQEQWHYAMRVAASSADLTGAVGKKLSSTTDILFSNLLSIASWLPDAPQDASWRAEILKRITAVLLAPSQYMTLRARAMAALIASRDPNLVPIFRQAVRSGVPTVRRLGCLGLGALRAEDAVADLRPMLVDDDRDVQIAAGLALGTIATEPALEIMVQGLLQGSEGLRQVIAQSLAGIPNEGHNILRDAAEHEDMLVRRASVFGLARIPANWSLIALYQIMTNDEQWYVRSAAEDNFFIARNPEREGPRRQPHAHEIPWLFLWAQNVGVEGVTQPEQVQDLLIQVLRDKRSKLRALAAECIGRIGLVKGIKPLYAMLMDQEPSVRTAAYESLCLLEMRTQQALPGTI